MVNLNTSASHDELQSAGPTAGSALYTVMVIALTVALLALGLAYGAKLWFEGQSEARAAPTLALTHNVIIGAQRYAIPASLLIDPTQRRDGFSERMDMTLALPLGPEGLLSEVEITVMPRARVRTSAALLDSVYLHQFAQEQISGPPGLVGKPLQHDPGTQGETVWYDPLNANPFVAKCLTPIAGSAGSKPCLRVMALSDRNTAVVSFDPAVLGNWRQFDARIEEALSGLRL